MSDKGLFNNGMTTSEENYYFTKGYQQGSLAVTTEILDKAIKLIENEEEKYMGSFVDGMEKCIDILYAIKEGKV